MPINVPAELRPIPDYGDLMPWIEFKEAVDAGFFIDYDGIGSWANATHCDERWENDVRPSLVKSGKQVPPAWATHVCWFNK